MDPSQLASFFVSSDTLQSPGSLAFASGKDLRGQGVTSALGARCITRAFSGLRCDARTHWSNGMRISGARVAPQAACRRSVSAECAC